MLSHLYGARHPRGGATLLQIAILLTLATATAGAGLHFSLGLRQVTQFAIEYEIAFRAAEVALLDAEQRLASVAHGIAASHEEVRLCTACHSIVAAWLNDTPHAGEATAMSNSVAVPAIAGDIAGARRSPRYIVELPGSPASGAAPPLRFRITAIGFGQRTGTRVILQSEFQL